MSARLLAQSPAPAPAPTLSPSPAAGEKSLLGRIADAGQLSTFLRAVQAAGLAEKLDKEGPFTVFAPTDEAFAKLPAGTLDTVLKPENKERLVQILSYHVIPGKQGAADLARNSEVVTLEGDELDIEPGADGKAAQVDEANITTADLDAANGVLHLIDRVLLP